MNYVSEELSDRYIRDAVLAAFALIRSQAAKLECDSSVPKQMHKMITEVGEAFVEIVISSALDGLEESGDKFIKEIKAATAEMMEEEND